jgi:repressor LexA
LRNSRGRARGGGGTIPLPVVGVLQPDQPAPALEADETPLDWVSLGRELVGEDEDVYALRVRGDGMMDALVNDGDLVVLKRKQSAENGEMVAVWHKPSQETWLKYYHRENGHVRLQAANPNLPPILAHPAEVEIQGQVLLIVRQAK